MYSRVLAIALCAVLAMPQGSVRSSGVPSASNPVVALGIFVGAGFLLYKAATTYERRCAHNRAITNIARARVDSCLHASDVVSFAKDTYVNSSHPLVEAYTHLGKIKKELNGSLVDLAQDAMLTSYADCADLSGQARVIIQEIDLVLPHLEEADGFKDELDRYMLSTVPSIIDTIDELKDEIRRHHCDCH